MRETHSATVLVLHNLTRGFGQNRVNPSYTDKTHENAN